MAQLSMREPKKPCLSCGEMTSVRSTRGKGSIPFCNRICESEYKRKQKYIGMRSGADDRARE